MRQIHRTTSIDDIARHVVDGATEHVEKCGVYGRHRRRHEIFMQGEDCLVPNELDVGLFAAAQSLGAIPVRQRDGVHFT
jgi:hypothetical protein